MRKTISVFIAMLMAIICCLPAIAENNALSDDIVILYTNDVHCHIDGTLSYDVLAAIKANLQTQYEHVLLADAGDHIQGTAFGSMDDGATIIQLMNGAGYDVATLGNHEFDYSIDRCLQLIDAARFPYIACNFHHIENGERAANVLDSYSIFECGDVRVAFIGICTPETFFKPVNLIYNENGEKEPVYDISGGADGAALYADVQRAIDDAIAAGADYVIGLGHLGADPAAGPWSSTNTIRNVSGLTAFIDGHSHTVIEAERVTGKDGGSVVLTQTGEYFDRIGMMVIDAETGDIATDFIEAVEITETVVSDEGAEEEIVVGYELESDLYAGTELISNEEIAAVSDRWISELDERLGVVIGYAEVTLDNYDSDGQRLVRMQETNAGDFSADALYYLFDSMGMDVDAAIINGGAVRNTAITGDLTYNKFKTVHAFSDIACLQTVSGQQLLDALEWSTHLMGTGKSHGGFLQVSGITFAVDTTIPDTTQKDENELWAGSPTGEYRVHDVKLYNRETDNWDALDLCAEYNIAGYDFVLREHGDGHIMFEDTDSVIDNVMEDYLVLGNYTTGFEDCVVGATNSPLLVKYPNFILDYGTTDGSGRIRTID